MSEPAIPTAPSGPTLAHMITLARVTHGIWSSLEKAWLKPGPNTTGPHYKVGAPLQMIALAKRAWQTACGPAHKHLDAIIRGEVEDDPLANAIDWVVERERTFDRVRDLVRAHREQLRTARTFDAASYTAAQNAVDEILRALEEG